MNSQDVIKIARQILSCPVCGRQFEAEKIQLSAAIDEKVVIQAACGRDHLPILAVFITVFSKLSDSSFRVDTKKDRLTGEDIARLSQKLKYFNGDFRTVFQSSNNNLNQ